MAKPVRPSPTGFLTLANFARALVSFDPKMPAIDKAKLLWRTATIVKYPPDADDQPE